MPELTINDKKVMARKGETVLEVCRREGIYVPTLCYQENLTPYGGCRMCIVEVEGNPRPMTSCTLPAEEGMKIKTDTPLLKDLRKFILQLILSEHPHACLLCDKKKECTSYMECIKKEPISFGCKYCVKTGTCELQKLVKDFEIKEVPFSFSYRNLAVEEYDPFFERDYNLCILCGRCVRACSELRNASVIDFHHRGPMTLVGTAFDLPHLAAQCQFCGACVDACPTGAMRERYIKYDDPPERTVATVCGLCSLCCDININVGKNRILNCTSNNNQLCVRGRFGLAQIVNHRKRVTVPLIRKEGRIVEIEWDEALSYATAKLSEYRGKVGMIFSPGLTIEAIDALTTAAELTGVEGFGAAVGISGNHIPGFLEKGMKKPTLVILNTDLLDDFSVMFLKIRKQSEDKPVLLAIDAIRTKLAEIADVWLRPRPGMEKDVLRVLLAGQKNTAETGVADKDIARAKKMLGKRKACLLYNPFNTGDVGKLDSVQLLPLTNAPNIGYIMNLGVMDGEDVLQNDSVDCLYMIGAAPKLRRPYRFVIVQDAFLPEVDFDLFLPAATCAEVDGSLIDIEGRTRKLHKAIEPTGRSRSDEWIIREITSHLDFELIGSQECKGARAVKTNGEVKLTDEYPFYLIVREDCYRFRNRSLAAIIRGFARLRGDRKLVLNPRDAERLHLAAENDVNVKGRDLALVMKAEVSDVVPEGVVFAYHDPWAGLVRNTAVRLERVPNG